MNTAFNNTLIWTPCYPADVLHILRAKLSRVQVKGVNLRWDIAGPLTVQGTRAVCNAICQNFLNRKIMYNRLDTSFDVFTLKQPEWYPMHAGTISSSLKVEPVGLGWSHGRHRQWSWACLSRHSYSHRRWEYTLNRLSGRTSSG